MRYVSGFDVVHKLYSEERPATSSETKKYYSSQNKHFNSAIGRVSQPKSAAKGAGAAGATLGLVGAALGGKKGAAIGAATGAGLGALGGNRSAKNKRKMLQRSQKQVNSAPVVVNRDDEGNQYTGPSLGLNSKKVKSFSNEVRVGPGPNSRF